MTELVRRLRDVEGLCPDAVIGRIGFGEGLTAVWLEAVLRAFPEGPDAGHATRGAELNCWSSMRGAWIPGDCMRWAGCH